MKKNYEVSKQPVEVIMNVELMMDPDGTYSNYSMDMPKCPTCEAESTYYMRFCPFCDQELIYPQHVEVEENGISDFQYAICVSCDSKVDMKGEDLSKHEIEKRYFNKKGVFCKHCRKVARGQI